MRIRKIKKFLKWLVAMCMVFAVSFLGTAAANGGLPLDGIKNSISQFVSLGESQLSETASKGSLKSSSDFTDEIEADDSLADDESERDEDETDIPDASETSAPDAEEDLSGSGAMSRMERIVFLKKAVHARINSADYVKLQDMPESLQQAVVAVEDRKFYNHWGFDMEGIFRASLVNLQYGEVKEGASTITQQLVKNLFLSQEQTMGRKAEEFVLAMDMELNYSKDEILELYLNTIYFGSGYYGIKEASEGYFGKEPAMLTLPEAAMLAGIPNAPSLYSPYVDFRLAKKRQIVVLDAMTAAGYLREAIAEDAKIKPIYLAH